MSINLKKELPLLHLFLTQTINQILEKSKKQKVIVPANFSKTPVFETSEQNISLTCNSGTTFIVILLNR